MVTRSAAPLHCLQSDEHCLNNTNLMFRRMSVLAVTPAGVFNIEGGCYAKVTGLTPNSPPGIHQALR